MNGFLLENIFDKAPQNSLKTQKLSFSTVQINDFESHTKKTNKPGIYL